MTTILVQMEYTTIDAYNYSSLRCPPKGQVKRRSFNHQEEEDAQLGVMRSFLRT
jgi:hypothetical protein